jgi:hypothetical protein
MIQRVPVAGKFKTGLEAIQYAQLAGGCPVLIGRTYAVIAHKTRDLIECQGTAFADLALVRGRVVTIPVNSDR